MTFCCHGSDARMGHMTSQDMHNFKWEGFITATGFRKYRAVSGEIERPVHGLGTSERPRRDLGDPIPDLKFWGNQRLLMDKGKCSFGWGKIGPCGTPIRTKEGWLIIFHAVSVVCDMNFSIMPASPSPGWTIPRSSSAWATSAS